MKKWLPWAGPLSCLLMIGSCFLPWAYYKAIDDTFTGVHVTRFPTGNYYGKAGMTITLLTFIIMILMLIPRVWAQRINLFMAGLLVAFALRTYVIFTGELIAGDVVKKPGIYLMVFFSGLVLLMALLMPAVNQERK